MPSLSTHVDQDTAALIENAAKASPQKRVAPWLAEAANQRLDREGLRSEEAAAKAEIIAIAEEKGPVEVLGLLRANFREAGPVAKKSAA